MKGHRSPISGIATSRDRYVATAGYDNQIILWDAANKAVLARSHHDHLANQCTFSPCGGYLATASSDHTARLWSVPGLELLAVFRPHADDVEMVAFHPDQPLVATASRDHLIRVFDFAGRLVQTFVGHDADVISVDWLPDGKGLVSSSDDGTVRRWELASGDLLEKIDMHGVETDTIAITPEGILCAGNDAGDVCVVLARSGLPDRAAAPNGDAESIAGHVRTVHAHDAGIKRLAYSPAKRLLVSISYDRTLKLFELAPTGELTLVRSSAIPAVVWARSCAFRGDHEIVFGTFGSQYAVFDHVAGRWDLTGIGTTGGFNAVAVHGADVYAIGDAGIVFKNGAPHQHLESLCNFLLPFGDRLLTGGQLGIVFDAVTGETIHVHTAPLNCGAVIGERAVIGTYNGEGLVFDRDGKLERTIALHDNAIKGLASDGVHLFSVCATGAAAFHDAALAPVRHIADAHDRIANGCVAVGADHFASISRDRKLRLWSGDRVAMFDTPHTHSIKCIAASRDGRFVATASYNGLAAVFEIASGTWVRVERLTASGVSSLCAHGDGFLASSYDGEIYQVAVR